MITECVYGELEGEFTRLACAPEQEFFKATTLGLNDQYIEHYGQEVNNQNQLCAQLWMDLTDSIPTDFTRRSHFGRSAKKNKSIFILG